jgi:hypothetical protein
MMKPMTTLNPGMRHPEPAIPHYYGDVVRILMIFGVGLMLLGIPFASSEFKVFIPLEIALSLPIVALAAFTNPWQSMIVAGDVLFSGVMAVFFEIAAYMSYERDELVPFVLYAAIGLLFLLAFYFSVKTLRAMMLHQVGKQTTLEEFNPPLPQQKKIDNPLESEQAFDPKFLGD